jgi:transposase
MVGMDKSKLSDEGWLHLFGKLKNRPVSGWDARPLVAGLWRRCFGCCVQAPSGGFCPTGLGIWRSVFNRFVSWSRFDVWEKMLAHVSAKADLENVCIDSTVVRAQACAAGAANSNAVAEALGRSRGGFSCKIHALTDALGLPVRFILTGGQAADITQAIPLLKDIGRADALLADKGYDANALLDWLGQRDTSGSDSTQGQPQSATKL